MTSVNIWEEKVIIPTYAPGEPDKLPLFFEKRVYQGSSGKVYPLAVTEVISDEKKDKTYNAVFIENEYLKIMILPELGGRIQQAIDKTNNYDFVYHNDVIKPALVGLVGPWISGGIEFNWPQHHRPSTFMPAEYKIENNDNGSKTLKISEIDQMYGTKGMASFTLEPGKSFIKIEGQLFNRTDIPQTFLWWANPAVPVNRHTYSVFPPDVNAVMDHGKRAVSTFPIATGEYYKYDYSEGVDISKYSNVPVPTSYMAAHSVYDFIGNYDANLDAGLLHVANHHLSPGKKQWTWGNEDFGQAWDRNLTDNNGPYIELMTGVFTDNQPDFTWLKPFEEKSFTQYFMPYKGVGHIKNATIDAAVNLEVLGNDLSLKVYVTSDQKDLEVIVLQNEHIIFSKITDLSPMTYLNERILDKKITEIDDSIMVIVRDQDSHILVSYQGRTENNAEIPDPEPILAKPEDLKSTEELYLAAEHLEQYRHATFDAEDYYLEGLRRDRSDIRLNDGYGLYLYRKGLFEKSEKYFRNALKKITWKTQNPYSGEPSYNLGLALLRQEKLNESFDHFYKATWSDESKDKAYFQLAKIASLQNKPKDAIHFLEKSITHNNFNMKARHMLVALLSTMDCVSFNIEEHLNFDSLDLGLNYEKAKQTNNYTTWLKMMRGSVSNFLEITIDYLEFGLVSAAKVILGYYQDDSPMVNYFRAYCELMQKHFVESQEFLRLAELKQGEYCFPNRIKEQQILETLISQFPDKTNYAKYALGNYYYDRRRYNNARKVWEDALRNIPEFSILNRNLSFIYYNQLNDPTKAKVLIENAFKYNPTDSRLLLELDTLYQKIGASVEERTTILENNLPLVKTRDSLLVEYLHLLNINGEYRNVIQIISQHKFHPWEGGEGKVSGEYKLALVESAKQEMMLEDYQSAIQKLQSAKLYPENLGEGKLPNVTENMLDYLIGIIYEKQGDESRANKYFKKATEGTIIPTSVLYYNDQPADDLLYQGLAYLKLGNYKNANKAFNCLISYGKKNMYNTIEYDYFAVSMPETTSYDDNIQYNNVEYCQYLIALGEIGQKNFTKAIRIFKNILEKNPSHIGSIQHLNFVNNIINEVRL